MTDLRTVWGDVGDRVERLGLKVKLHVEEELAERDDGGSTWDRLGSTLEELLDGLGDAYDDPAVRTDARSLGEALAAAVDATATEIRSRLP